MTFYMFKLALVRVTQNELIVGMGLFKTTPSLLNTKYFYLFNIEKTDGSHKVLLSYPTVCVTIEN